MNIYCSSYLVDPVEARDSFKAPLLLFYNCKTRAFFYKSSLLVEYLSRRYVL